jgi:hypothetical protein
MFSACVAFSQQFCGVSRHRHGIGNGKNSSGDRPAESFFANQFLRENTASAAFKSSHERKDGGHKKGRSGGRCGLSEAFVSAGDRLVVVAAVGRTRAP